VKILSLVFFLTTTKFVFLFVFVFCGEEVFVFDFFVAVSFFSSFF